MPSLPRVYRTFAEFEQDELRRMNDELDIDEMLDDAFQGELDIEFKGRQAAACASPIPLRRAS